MWSDFQSAADHARAIAHDVQAHALSIAAIVRDAGAIIAR